MNDYHRTGRLVLVPDPPAIHGDVPVSGGAEGASPSQQVPFVIRQTMEQVLRAAEDTNVRAEILVDVAKALEEENQGPADQRVQRLAEIDRRVSSLRAVTLDLKGILATLVERWTQPERSR